MAIFLFVKCYVEGRKKNLVVIVFGSIKGPELINMYVGQSEENVRKGIEFIYLFEVRFIF